jgi:hypothetical protein
MITTTLAVLALAGGLSSGNIPSGPSWQTDYAQAMTRASAERKPMAVFIGHGADRFKQILAEGTVPADAAKILQNSYVCMYLDTDTASGKELAGRFAISEGLVISGPGGTTQAYRHNGTLTGTELTKQLGTYAAAGQPTTTISGGVVVAQPTTGSVIVGGTTYQAAPRYVYPAGGYAYPTYQLGGYPSINCVGPR